MQLFFLETTISKKLILLKTFRARIHSKKLANSSIMTCPTPWADAKSSSLIRNLRIFKVTVQKHLISPPHSKTKSVRLFKKFSSRMPCTQKK
jgi:hypothetical protein